MEKAVLEQVKEQTRQLMAASSCCQEAKDAAQAWLDAVGTPGEKEAAQRYVQELEEDITSVDDLIAFAESEGGKKYFGEAAGAIASHGREIKAAGAKYCDCPACGASAAILAHKAQLLG